MPEETVAVYFDYLCPYAWRGAEVVWRAAEPLHLRFVWHHYSLVQAERRGDAPQLWNDRVDPADDSGGLGLLPFLASIAAARQAGGALHDDFRLALMRLRHRDGMPYRRSTMLAAAEEAGLRLAAFERELDDPEARTLLARQHHAAVDAGVTGSPTFRFASGHSANLQLKDVPHDVDEAVDLLRTVRAMLERHPYLQTVRRPMPLCN